MFYCHFVHCFGFAFVAFLLFSCDLMTNFSVVFAFLFFFCVCASIVAFWVVVTMRF